MSIDSLAFIIENAYAVKYTVWAFGMVVHYQLHAGDDWQQIELDSSTWGVLNKRYKAIVEKWVIAE